MAVQGGIAVASMAMSAYSANKEAGAIEQQGKFQAIQNRRNAEIADMKKSEILAKSDNEQNQMAGEVNQMLGANIAKMAAMGIDVDGGLVNSVIEDTLNTGREDIDTIRDNARREAWGMEVEASNMRGNANMATNRASAQAESARATGGLNAINAGMQAYGKYQKQ